MTKKELQWLLKWGKKEVKQWVKYCKIVEEKIRLIDKKK